MNLMNRLTKFWLKTSVAIAVVFGRQQRAVHLYQQILRLDPQEKNARSSLSNLLMQMGNSAGAINELTLQLEHYPNHAESWFNLGYVYEQQDNLIQAEKCFRRAIELKPIIDRAWYGLALVLIRSERLREAVDALKENVRLQPFSPYGWYQLGMTYHHLGEDTSALQVVEKLDKFEPRYAATLRRDMGKIPS